MICKYFTQLINSFYCYLEKYKIIAPYCLYLQVNYFFNLNNIVEILTALEDYRRANGPSKCIKVQNNCLFHFFTEPSPFVILLRLATSGALMSLAIWIPPTQSQEKIINCIECIIKYN